MAVLGSLVVQMAVDLARFRSDMGAAANVSNTRLREIQRSAETTVRQISAVGKSVASVLGAVGIGLSVAGIVGTFERMGRAAIEFGDTMQKAAAKTGISASEFSSLAGAARLADVDVQSLSTALKKMQVAISEAGSGGKEPLQAFTALGIKFAEFRKLAPETQFETIADQISKLKDPADRTRAAVALFGKAGADLLPFFEDGAAGIREAREEIEKLGGKLTDDQIKKLSEADDAIKRLTLSWDGFARVLTARVAPTLAGVLNALAKNGLTTSALDFIREVKKAQEGGHEPASGSSGILARQTHSSGVLPPGFQDIQTDAERLAALRKRLNEILPEVRVDAQRTGLTAVQQVLADMNKATQTEIESEIEAWTDFKATLDDLLNSGTIDSTTAAARIKERLDKELPEIRVTADKIFPPQERSQLTAFAEQAAHNIQDSFAEFLFNPFDKGLKGMLAGFLDTIRQMVAQLAAQQLLKAFFSFGSGLGGGVGSFFGKLAGARAGGGPVTSGRSYLVGEKGPEMFVPGMSGSIIPNGGWGGGAAVVNVHNSITINDETDLKRSMPAIASEITRQSVASAKAEIRNDLSRRGRIR
jgi:hypothetical protein